MEKNQNLEELQKIASVFRTGNILTDDQVQSVLKNIMVILANYRKSTETMNSETKTIVLKLLNKLDVLHEANETKLTADIEKKHGDFTDRVDSQISEVRKMFDDVMAAKPKDGENARPEDVVPLVMAQVKELMPDMDEDCDPLELVDQLMTLEGEDRLPAEAIEETSLVDIIKSTVISMFKGKTLRVGTGINTNGGGVQSITSKDGSVTLKASGAKGKGVVDLSVSVSGSGLSKETPSGTIDNSNLIFTVTHQPFFINVNGAIYNVGDGAYASYVAGTITLNYPVGTGGFIKSYY